MRKLLLATTAAALALTFAAQAGAEPNKIIPAATTVAPPEATSTDGLVFSKDANQARPIDKPGEQAAPAEQAQEPVKPVEAAKPTEPAASTVALAAEDTAVAAQLKELVEMLDVPAVNTLMGLGALSAEHPNFVSMPGMHGSYAANMGMSNADLLIALGVRFDDRGALPEPADRAPIRRRHDARDCGQLSSRLPDHPRGL